jgi:mannose-6-phosphate isomerase-like protein (cupin superfamily)
MNYMIAHFDEIEPVRCPCGWAKRAFAQADNHLATMHVVKIGEDSRAHYHKKMTELYFVLKGEGEIELDGARYPISAGSAVFIKPGCRHRAVGTGLELLNVPIPAFDPEDEWFDEVDEATAPASRLPSDAVSRGAMEPSGGPP